MYISPDIQKDILQIFGNEVRTNILDEIGNAKFCILVDESKDIADKEQMTIVLRFVDIDGFLKERYFEIVHVPDTTSATLHSEIKKILKLHGLLICNMRGQGYDGANNTSGAWNGLQALFLKECPYTYYIHCFAHRLQLALVGATEKNKPIWNFFSKLACIVNLIDGSAKRHTQLRSAQVLELSNMISTGERQKDSGLNQISSLHWACKTRWSSHIESITSLIDMYKPVLKVLGFMEVEASKYAIQEEAAGCLATMKYFEFIFVLHLTHKIMSITRVLSDFLQKKSLDILYAIDFVSSTKELLQKLREEGFDSLLMLVQRVCIENDVAIPNMSDPYNSSSSARSSYRGFVTFDHHYSFDIFVGTIDLQVKELNSMFNYSAIELLRLSSALEPRDNFKLFKLEDICSLTQKCYPQDFDETEMNLLRSELSHYIHDIPRHLSFQNLSSISELCQKLVETKIGEAYSLVDRLIRLVLTLPISTATTERAFSAMKFVKSILQNKMGDECLSNSLVMNIERELCESIDVDLVINEFATMKPRMLKFM